MKRFKVLLVLLVSVLFLPLKGQSLVAAFETGGDTNLSVVKVCKGYSVQFNDVSQGVYVNRFWTFAGGAPLLSTAPSANVNFSILGNHNCSLKITDSAGVSNTINFVVQVGTGSPSSTFGALNNVCSSDPAFPLYGGAPSGGYYIGPGVSNNLFDPGVADSGTHVLGYVYTGANGCNDTSYSSIYVSKGPDAALYELNSFSNCNGFSTGNPDFLITIFNISTSLDSIIKYEIVWGDGTADWDSTGFDPNGFSHTYYGEGRYWLNFIITSLNGCVDTATYMVLNTSNPASLNITNPGGTNGCAPVTVTFPLSTTNTDTAISYTISWGDGQDTTFNHPPPALISHTYDTTSCVFPGGFFNIIAVAENECVTTQSTVAGPFVTQPAIAEFSPVPGCVNKPHSLTNLSVPGYSNACSRLTTFIWDFGDGTPPVIVNSMAPVPPPGTHTWTATGIYNVQLVVVAPGGNCPGDTIDYDVCIEDDKVANVSFIDTIGCAPVNLKITNSSDTSSFCTGVISYWELSDTTGVTFGFGTDLSSYTPSLAFGKPGVFTLSYIIGNNCNQDTMVQKIYVREEPTVNFPNDPMSFCDTLNIDFAIDSLHHPNVNSNWATVQSYEWDISPKTFTYLGGTDSTSQYPKVRLAPNTYTIIHTVTNACGVATDTQIVVVNTLTNGGFNIDVNEGCSPLSVNVQSTSAAGVNHEWYLNGQLYGTTRDTSFVFQNDSLFGDSIIQIKLAVFSGGGSCADTIRETVKVFPYPHSNFDYSQTCIGDTLLYFDSTKVAYAPVLTWDWDFGDSTQSSVKDPAHFYSLPGKYPVSLTTLDSNGCSNFYLDTVWVRSDPAANFTFNYSSIPDSACVLDTVFFLDSTVVDVNGAPILAWEWDVFNDGVIDDTLQNSSYIFNSKGVYDVKLRVTSENGCVDSVIKQIHISTPPLPQFSLSQDRGCTPISVVVTNNSSGYIKDWLWEFYTLDSNSNQIPVYTSTLKDPNPLPPMVANGLTNSTILTKLTTSNDCYSDYHLDTITVIPVPIPFFQMSVDTGCSPLTITIQTDGVVSGQPDSIMFNFGDGSPLLKLKPLINVLPNGDTLFTWNQQQHTFTYNGNKLDTTYFITLRGINECGDSTFTSPITVKTRSVQSFFNTSTNSGCAPLTVKFNNYSFSATTISYCFDYDSLSTICSGGLSSGWNPTYTFTQPGQYVVAQFVSNDCGADTSYQIIDVLPKPIPQINYSNIVCKGDTVDFLNNTTLAAGQIIGYEWSFGDGDTSSVINPKHVFDTAGVYTICLTVSTAALCDTTFCSTIMVNPKPTPDYSFVDLLCVNQQPFQFFNLSTNTAGNIISYKWDFGDGNTSTLLNPQHHYTTAGAYDVQLKIMNDSYCEDSLTQQLTVLPVPAADFNFGYQSGDSCGVPQTVLFTNLSNGAGGYYWDFDHKQNLGVNTSTNTHPSFTYSAPGVYEVMLVSSNGFSCDDTVYRDVVIHPVPTVEFSADAEKGCAALDVSFTDLSYLPQGFNDILYQYWSFGDGSFSTTQNPVHRYSKPGTYTVTLKVTTEFGCSDSLTYQNFIEVFPVPEPEFNFKLIEFGIYSFTQQTTGGVPPYQYSWDFGDGQTSTDPDPVHTFNINRNNYREGYIICLTVTDANGCDSTTCDSLRVGDFTLYVPNAMSPGVDGDAGVFLPKGQGLESYECQVFDRWGNLLWRTTELDPSTASPVEGWDGTHNGEPVPMGVYVWRIDARFENGVEWRRFDEDGELMGNTGTITVLR